MSLNKTMMTRCVLIALMLSCFMAQGQGGSSSEKIAIKIGLLISDSTSVEAKYGALRAAGEVNRNGGVKGHPLELVIRSMEGPWGRGSKQAVDLIFEEEVWAVLGVHEGRNAHLVEQVIAKTGTVFVSAWAADPTLSKAFVPWYFNVVPNDEQQSKTVLDHLRTMGSNEMTGLVVEHGYDSEMAADFFVSASEREGHPIAVRCDFNGTEDFESVLNGIRSSESSSVVLFGKHGLSLPLIRFLRANQVNVPIYTGLSLLGEAVFSTAQPTDFNQVYILGSEAWAVQAGSDFFRDFEEVHGWSPGPMAATSYDGLKLLAIALERSGLDRERLLQAVSQTNFEGMTGKHSFDQRGNRKESPKLVRIPVQNLSFSER